MLRPRMSKIKQMQAERLFAFDSVKHESALEVPVGDWIVKRAFGGELKLGQDDDGDECYKVGEINPEILPLALYPERLTNKTYYTRLAYHIAGMYYLQWTLLQKEGLTMYKKVKARGFYEA